MANTYFQFKKFIVQQDQCAMKVCTDSCLFGAWVANKIGEKEVSFVLDIGCGTALLSLMLAQKTNAFIDAVEIDAPASRQALANVLLSPWDKQIKVINKPLSEYISLAKKDVIICNPPFFENQLQSNREELNFARHETGLRPGELFRCINECLTREGKVFILVPFQRRNAFKDEAAKYSLFVNEMVLVRQTPSHDIFRAMLSLSRDINTEPEINEMAIHDGERNYSKAFRHLLADYYLDL